MLCIGSLIISALELGANLALLCAVPCVTLTSDLRACHMRVICPVAVQTAMHMACWLLAFWTWLWRPA